MAVLADWNESNNPHSQYSMSCLILYSTNVFLKQYIQSTYRRDSHYVWCSEAFDSATVGRYKPGALVPASSNPANIYRQLTQDVKTNDRHSAKINEQKASFIRLAHLWEANGEITSDDRDDIIFMVNNAGFDYWRPLVYVIPYNNVSSRLQTVPMSKRAGLGLEYIIPDLQRSEFDLIEL
jgi:hypothetical protein